MSSRNLILQSINQAAEGDINASKINISFKGNGESPFTRAVLPLLSAKRTGESNLPPDVLSYIFSFLLPVSNDLFTCSNKIGKAIDKERE